MSDFKFSLYYLAIVGTGSTLMAGHSFAAAQLTLWVAVGFLPLIINGGWRRA